MNTSNTGQIENNAVTSKWVTTPSELFSMRTGSLVSSQICPSGDAYAWCKRTRRRKYEHNTHNGYFGILDTFK